MKFLSHLKNFLSVSISEYIAAAVLFILNILISRNYGVEAFGQFSFAFSLGQIIIAVLGGGINFLIRRDFVKDKSLAQNYFITFLLIRLFLILCCSFVLGIGYIIGILDGLILIMLVARMIEGLNDTIYALYQSKNKFLFSSVTKSIHYLFLLCCCGLAIYYLFAIDYIYINFLALSLSVFIFLLLLLFNSKEYFFAYQPNDTYIKTTLKNAFPLLVANILFVFSSRVNILILKSSLQPIEFGIYNICMNILTIFTIFSNAIGNVIYNQLTTSVNQKDQILSKLYSLSKQIGSLGLVACIIIILFSNMIFSVFGANQAYSYALKIVSAALIPIFIQVPFNYILTIYNKTTVALIFSGIMLCIISTIYFILSSIWGFDGAIYAHLICMSLWLVGIVLVSKQTIVNHNYGNISNN